MQYKGEIESNLYPGFYHIQEMEHLRHRLTSWKHNFAPVAERIYTEK